jgi:cell division septation protein DedD
MAELYKDKVEVSLDGRQIFYLFFGGAVIVGMVFVLGVMVGRRVESRGHIERAHAEATVDPLAALDRLEGSGGLTFQGALRGTDPPAADVDRKIDEIAKARQAAKAEAKPETKVDPAKVDAKPEVKVDAKPEAKLDGKKPDSKPEAKADAKPDAKKSDGEKKQRFTLQLSSFQDKGEAEAFLASIKDSGFPAFLAEGDVDGKQYFRVRLGSYRSLDAANDAKAEFEKAAKKTALVTRL